MHILHTVLYTFPNVLARRICLTIKRFFNAYLTSVLNDELRDVFWPMYSNNPCEEQNVIQMLNFSGLSVVYSLINLAPPPWPESDANTGIKSS